MTVYDSAHVGHARSFFTFDIIYRYLRFAGFEVEYVRNYTDVDDKIINRANERGITSQELAETFIRAFDEDMRPLAWRCRLISRKPPSSSRRSSLWSSA